MVLEPATTSEQMQVLDDGSDTVAASLFHASSFRQPMKVDGIVDPWKDDFENLEDEFHIHGDDFENLEDKFHIHGIVDPWKDDFENLEDKFHDDVSPKKENTTGSNPASVLLAAALGVGFSAAIAHMMQHDFHTFLSVSTAESTTGNVAQSASCCQDGLGIPKQAVQPGNETLLRELLNVGANPDVQDDWGSTPLHVAAAQGNMKAAEMLLMHHANVNALDVWHETPLHMAAHASHQDVCKLLVEGKGDVNAKNFDERTPLFLAAKSNATEVCEYLFNQGAGLGEAHEDEIPSVLTAMLLQRVVLAAPSREDGL